MPLLQLLRPRCSRSNPGVGVRIDPGNTFAPSASGDLTEGQDTALSQLHYFLGALLAVAYTMASTRKLGIFPSFTG